MDEIYYYALKLLRRKDYTQRQLGRKLEAKFGNVPEDVTSRLVAKRFLDDRRYAENFVSKRADSHRDRVREELQEAGIDDKTIDLALQSVDWPSLRTVLKDKMNAWRLSPPLDRRDAARLFRTLSRLGHPEDELREELEQLS